MKTCHTCGKGLELGRLVSRKDVCPQCGADVRCCLNCSFYDPRRPKQCRETRVELVREKSRANYCEYFLLRDTGAPADAGAADDARRELNDLFKKP